MKRIIALAAVIAAILSADAGVTDKLLKTRSKKTDPITLGKWHCNFTKCKKYAQEHKIPLIAVWSNGDYCGHCVTFESAVMSKVFRNWQATNNCVMYFICSYDGGDGEVGSKVFHWIRKNKNTSYPFVRIWWPEGDVDVATVGDKIDKKKDGMAGGKNAVAFFKKVLADYDPKSQEEEEETEDPGDEGDEADEAESKTASK